MALLNRLGADVRQREVLGTDEHTPDVKPGTELECPKCGNKLGSVP